jgi:predicted nuclease of predicted toxin-antitoxin system
MRFLANENFPGAAVTALEAAGHDVVWVRIAAPGTTDPDVLAWAAREERILLTLDKDFANWPEDRRCRVHAVSSCCARRCSDVGQRTHQLRA